MDKKNRLRLIYQELRSRGLVHTQKAFAEALGKAEGTMSRAFAGDAKALTDNLFIQISKTFPDMFTQSWLLTGEGDMLVQHQEPTTVTRHDDPNIEIINLQKKTIAALEQQIADLRESLADKNEIIYLLRQKISNLTYDAAFPNGYPSVAAESPNVSPQNPENAQTPD